MARVIVKNPKTSTKFTVEFVIVRKNLIPLLGSKAAQQMRLIKINKENFESVTRLSTPGDDSNVKQYLENVKSLALKSDTFYFTCNADSARFWYDNAPIGINSLNKILPDKLCRSWIKEKNLSQFEGNLFNYAVPKLSGREINKRTNRTSFK